MNKHIVIYVATLLILFQSCVIYQDTSVTLVQAKDEGQVKLIGTNGIVYKYKDIQIIDSVYYGVGREYLNEREYVIPAGAKTPLDSAKFTAIYLKDKKKSKILTIFLVIGGAIPIAYLAAGSLFFLIGGF